MVDTVVPQSVASPQVLVLNSYHPGYSWSDAEQTAVLHTLAEGRPDIMPRVEYLDRRRYPDAKRETGILNRLESKYGRGAFQLIVALDDPAVELVLKHRDYFGERVPVVFGGVNDVEPEHFAAFPEVTGVAQTYDFAGTLALIHRLQPNVRRIAAVHCRTESGLASRHAFEKVLALEKPPFAIDWVEGWTAESLLQRVSLLPDDTAVLILSIFRDEAGKVLVDDPDFGRSLAARSRVPVYFVAPPLVRSHGGETWENAVWQGMGGRLLSEGLHGELVGKLALRVLAGEPAGSIPIVTKSPAITAFDYRQLQRFEIALAALPPDAVVFHAPPTFYQVHRTRIVAALVVIVVLAVSVLLLMWIVLQRRRAEQALRRSHEHFRLIARATNDAVWDWELADGTLWWNEGYVEQLKLAPDTPMGFAAWQGHVHPDDREWLVKLLRETLHSGVEHSQAEYRVVRSDGEIRHVLDRIFVARRGTESPTRLLGARLDLTERLRAELERLRLAAAIEQSSEAILLFDADGAVRYANPAFERTTGLAAPRTLQEVEALFRIGEGAQPLTEVLARAEAERPVHRSARRECVRRDGTSCLLQLAVFPIRDRGGQVISHVLVGQDVTHESKLEEQVRLSQKMEAVGLLAGGIAHDFNNLLQVIGGFAMQAQEATADDDRNDCLQQVSEACTRAVQLTRQLLVFSRDDKCAQLTDLDLNDLLAGQIKMLRRLLDAQIEVVLKPAAVLGNVRGDRGQIEQVFMNLCINARDAMPRGGRITLEVDEVGFDAEYCVAHPWAAPGRFARVAVTDTGTGMDRATMARIFDPFFTTKPKDKGTGLGLAVVYGIIQKHGGLIHVYSEVGVGTTFRVFLPVQVRGVAAVPQAERETPRPGSGTILVVEDDPSVGKLATRVLEKAGYTVLLVEDGERAWQLYLERSATIDLLVLDAILPGLSGREIYEKVRSRDPHKPVLFCSGYSAGTIQPEFFPGDEVKMLGKPYNPNELLRLVAEMIHGNAA
jgi:PAS domain S-box-containing protein